MTRNSLPSVEEWVQVMRHSIDRDGADITVDYQEYISMDWFETLEEIVTYGKFKIED